MGGAELSPAPLSFGMCIMRTNLPSAYFPRAEQVSRLASVFGIQNHSGGRSDFTPAGIGDNPSCMERQTVAYGYVTSCYVSTRKVIHSGAEALLDRKEVCSYSLYFVLCALSCGPGGGDGDRSLEHNLASALFRVVWNKSSMSLSA